VEKVFDSQLVNYLFHINFTDFLQLSDIVKINNDIKASNKTLTDKALPCYICLAYTNNHCGHICIVYIALCSF